MHIESIAAILDPVKTAGAMAWEAQRNRQLTEREYKADGTVLTAVDRQLDQYLFDEVSRLFPDANVLTEEEKRPFDPQKPFTFAIDPIDGTDSFSQGMPGWAISVGLLDHNMRPIAGIVFSPALDLLFFADLGKRASCNGREVQLSTGDDALSPAANIMISSRVHREIDISRCPGTFRGLGSAALHLCFPVVYPYVVGTIQQSKTHIWDIVGAHAINLSVGLDVQYLSGKPIDYTELTDGHQAAETILSGPERVIAQLRDVLKKQ